MVSVDADIGNGIGAEMTTIKINRLIQVEEEKLRYKMNQILSMENLYTNDQWRIIIQMIISKTSAYKMFNPFLK